MNGRSAILNGFRVDFIVEDQSLAIEAESLKDGEFFFKVFTGNDIKALSQHAFTAPQDFAGFIGYALDRNDSRTSITMSEDAVITLSQTSQFGGRERTLSIKLELEWKFIHPLDMGTKHLRKLQELKEGGQLTPVEEQTIKILNQIVRFNRSQQRKEEETNVTRKKFFSK